jgi:hypothetical protein
LTQVKRDRRKPWEYPWGYRESFMIVLELLLLGLILQVLSGGRQFSGLHWPLNMIAGISLIILLLIVHLSFRRKPFIKWLSSIPAAVSSMTFFAFVVFLLGFIPQQDPNASGLIKILGLSSIRNGWLLFVSGLFLLTCLGFVIMRRTLPINRRNTGFLFSHAGLWIIVFAASLGSGDLIRLTVQLTEGGEPQNTGLDQSENAASLPFSFKLLDFAIDEYPPKIGIGNSKTGELVDNSVTRLSMNEEDQEYLIDDWEVRINKILPNAYPIREEYISIDSTGAAPAALINVRNIRTNDEYEGWISCGSFAFPPTFLQIDNDYVFFMNQPEPEKYSSLIEIIQHDKTDTVIIEVNKPKRVQRFSLYQVSYDEHLGKWSSVSVIEAIKDPWLPVVYIGIIMMLAGSVNLFWKGNEIRKE